MMARNNSGLLFNFRALLVAARRMAFHDLSL